MVSPNCITVADFDQLPYLREHYESLLRSTTDDEELNEYFLEELESHARRRMLFKRELGYGQHAYYAEKEWTPLPRKYFSGGPVRGSLEDLSPQDCTEDLWLRIMRDNRDLLCKRWQKKEMFLDDVGPMPHPYHLLGQLARIDTLGPLSPSNAIFLVGKDGTSHPTAIRKLAARGDIYSPTSALPREYRTWTNLKQRCTNLKNPAFVYEGMDERWENFRMFLSDMGPGPGSKFRLERIDKGAPYCRENCRWIGAYGT